ncbi:MAG TPA: hypothetical protein VKA15_10920 [Isosphaeraceae bacterium]|nr:hypothetical protein [Isosphaeraceae bacterium]
MLLHTVLKVGTVPLLAASLLAWAGAMARADDPIDKALCGEAPKVLKYVKDHDYHTVGVLKFTVKKGNQSASLNAGTLNTSMALRLEHALIMLIDKDTTIEVIHEASQTAATHDRGATFKNARGRRGLFELAYPIAWAAPRKTPDVFLTGEVLIDKDMKQLTIVIQAFDRKNPEAVHEVLRIKNVPTNRNVLAGIGQSFVLSRRLLLRGPEDVDVAAADDASQRDDNRSNPLQDSEEPIKLEVFYDDSPVSLETDPNSPGEVRVRRNKAIDPKEGQKVKFVASNTTKETVGVVLAVNGKSTLFQEDLTTKSPGECTKWVLGPGQSYTIEGFYMTEDGKEVRPFKVLSDEESAKVELAPEHKGVFSLFVFRAGSSAAMDISTEGGDLGRSPKMKPGAHSRAEVQASLRTATHTRVSNGRLLAERVTRHPVPPRRATQKEGRGLVVEDTSSAGSSLNRVDAKLDPQPAMSLFIRYYTGPTPNAG